jgi:thymidylate synthase ThyX
MRVSLGETNSFGGCMYYHSEDFTTAERAILARHFTNLDAPVFGLINLPEVIKSALFARYSRSSKSMRRLFLDEFVSADNLSSYLSESSRQNIQQPFAGDVDYASNLFDKIFTDYGDDSVAQLGGAHIACEQASNILTKVLEKGRLASYLEQSTRFIFFDKLIGGSYRYGVPPEIAASPLVSIYRSRMDLLFETYKALVPTLTQYYGKKFPCPSGVGESAWKASIRGRVCDDLRGLLPASTLSNVGIFASGQAFELLVIRMRSHPLREVRQYGELILAELRKIVPSFVKRVDIPDRGIRWSQYFEDIDVGMRQLVGATVLNEPIPMRSEVSLVEWDPDAELKIVASAVYPYSQLPHDRILDLARNMTDEERQRIIETYCGARANRRHKPARAFESANYTFDVLAPYSVFRDLQRHRMLTIEWQELSTAHGFQVPETVDIVGGADAWKNAMWGASDLYDEVDKVLGTTVAQYVVPFGFKVRFYWHLNAREAFHVIELRTQRGGDPAYRRICQEMHRLIKDQAGHVAIANAMCFMDDEPYDLGRLESEQRTQVRQSMILQQQYDLNVDLRAPRNQEGT